MKKAVRCLCVLIAAAFVIGVAAASTQSLAEPCTDSPNEFMSRRDISSSFDPFADSSSSSSSSKKKKDIPGWEGSFIQQLLFFSPPLTEFGDIWKVLCIWNLLGFALIYLICGIVAGFVFKNHSLAIVIPLISAIVGSIAGFFCGAILCNFTT